DSAHNQSSFARYIGKGGIDLQNPQPPLQPSLKEAIEIARRLSFPADIARARRQWRALLDAQTELKPVAEDSSVPGILVFAIKGTAEQARTIASTLDSYRNELRQRYFDSQLEGPTLVVLANLGTDRDGESLGSTLSRAVHFRDVSGSEGYFEALDHTIVLR